MQGSTLLLFSFPSHSMWKCRMNRLGLSTTIFFLARSWLQALDIHHSSTWLIFVPRATSLGLPLWWQLGLLGLLHQGSFLRLYLKIIWFHTGESGFNVGTVYLLCTRRDQCWGQVQCAQKVLWWDIARGSITLWPCHLH